MRNFRGITLVSLVITIIVMLILAGVSLNMILGENSILERAQKAVIETEKARIKENVNMALSVFSITSYVNKDDAFTNYLEKKVQDGTFEEFVYAGMYLVKYEGKYCELKKTGRSYEVANILDEGLTEIDGQKYVVITPNTINSGERVDFVNDSQYIVLDNVNAKNFDFYIKSGNNVTIRLVGNMEIDNREFLNRSAIHIEPGGTLNLYVYGNVTVNSSFGGKSGSGTSADDTAGGSGANAGIYVPTGATLNLHGSGKLICIGGDAGDGGTCPTNTYDAGGGGGGGAGAGIGGNGGNGGDTAYSNAKSGLEGDSAGTIRIWDTLEVYAYGGGAGSGGDATPTQGQRRWRPEAADILQLV